MNNTLKKITFYSMLLILPTQYAIAKDVYCEPEKISYSEILKEIQLLETDKLTKKEEKKLKKLKLYEKMQSNSGNRFIACKKGDLINISKYDAIKYCNFKKTPASASHYGVCTYLGEEREPR